MTIEIHPTAQISPRADIEDSTRGTRIVNLAVREFGFTPQRSLLQDLPRLITQEKQI